MYDAPASSATFDAEREKMQPPRHPARRVRPSTHHPIGLFVFIAALAQSVHAAPPQFTVKFTKDASEKPYTGRVFICLTRGSGDPLNAGSWLSKDPLLALDVKDWKPETPLVFDAERTIGYPGGLND